mgnify:CR=1 FL=1
MIQSPRIPNQKAPLKTRRMIWLAMTASLVMYFILAYLQRDSQAPYAEEIDSFTLIIYSISIVTAAGSVLLPRLVKNSRMSAISVEIAQWALAEATAIYGLVLEVGHHSPRYFGLPLMTAGLALILYLAPRMDQTSGRPIQ